MNSSLYNISSSETDSSNFKLVFLIAYFILFVIGAIGNGIVIVMICNVLSSIRKSRSSRKSMSTTSHVFIYVLGLSIVDLLVILHLPFLIIDMFKGEWMFGNGMCKLYWFGESVNKLLSSFLMCVLSWDRFLAVCRPLNSMTIRSNSVALFVLLASSILATVLLLPVLTQAKVVQYDKKKLLEVTEGSIEWNNAAEDDSLVTKCSFESDGFFVVYTFIIGFLLPALLITFFYVQVIHRLRSNSKNMLQPLTDHKRSDGNKNTIISRVHQVTKRIITVIFFYFFCWTPQYTLTLLVQFNAIEVNSIYITCIFLCSHLLVCFNSAANPVLYALINRELRAQHLQAMARKRQSITAATQVAIEFVIQQTNNDNQSNRHPSIITIIEDSTIERTTLTTRIYRILAGFKLNLFNNGPKKSVSRSTSKCSQLSLEHTKETMQIGSSCQLKDEAESVSLTIGDAYL